MPEVRTYPISCQSNYCGVTTCPSTCPGLPDLTAFQAWKERTKATKPDPIWCPTVYQATHP